MTNIVTIIDIDDVFCILGEIIDKLIDFVTFFYFILVKNEANCHGMLLMAFVRTSYDFTVQSTDNSTRRNRRRNASIASQ